MKTFFSVSLLLSLFATAAAATPRAATESVPMQWSSGPYRYDGAGNITSIGSDTYRYDGANRLMQATAHTPRHHNTQVFRYDAFGNLLRMDTSSIRDGGSPYTLATVIAADPATNRTTASRCGGFNESSCIYGAYDEAGNQTWSSAGVQYEYDALGMMVVLRSGIREEQYVYDANNERIATAGASETRVTLRDLDGKVARELTVHNGAWQWKKDYVHRDGTLLAAILPGAVHHFHLDHLGTPRLITDDRGMKVSAHTYWPFGAEAPGSEPDAERMKFTGHERDFGSGPGEDLDYMHARYYVPNGGRLLSVDPVWDLETARVKPQMWNRYAYALNNPIVLVDPTGAVVDLSLLTSQQRNDLLESLNKVTGNVYGINNDRELTVVSYRQNASPTATAFLDSAIGAGSTYTAHARNNSGVNLMNAVGNDINIDFADFKDMKMSGLNPEANGLGSVFLHELGHTHYGLFDPPAAGTPGVPEALDAKHTTGATVDFVNQIHRERGLPERGPSYAPQNTNTTFTNRVRVPFIDPKTGKMVYVWPKLRQR